MALWFLSTYDETWFLRSLRDGYYSAASQELQSVCHPKRSPSQSGFHFFWPWWLWVRRKLAFYLPMEQVFRFRLAKTGQIRSPMAIDQQPRNWYGWQLGRRRGREKVMKVHWLTDEECDWGTQDWEARRGLLWCCRETTGNKQRSGMFIVLWAWWSVLDPCPLTLNVEG